MNHGSTDLIDRLAMGDWIDRRCGTYSGGMRGGLDLAAGLLHRPNLLVLDEPTVGLDIESRSAIWELLRQLVSQKAPVCCSAATTSRRWRLWPIAWPSSMPGA